MIKFKWGRILTLLIFNQYHAGFAQSVYYVQLHPTDNKKIVFQIRPDQNYSDVNAYINFYMQNGTLIKKNVSFAVTDENDKYIKKDIITSRIFDISGNGVGLVKVNNVKCKEARGKADKYKIGEQINISGSNSTLDAAFISNLKPPENAQTNPPKPDNPTKPELPLKSGQLA